MKLNNKGKIMKLVIDRNGLVCWKSKYIPIYIQVNDQLCLQILPLRGKKWLVMCCDEDYDTFGDFTDV